MPLIENADQEPEIVLRFGVNDVIGLAEMRGRTMSRDEASTLLRRAAATAEAGLMHDWHVTLGGALFDATP